MLPTAHVSPHAAVAGLRQHSAEARYDERLSFRSSTCVHAAPPGGQLAHMPAGARINKRGHRARVALEGCPSAHWQLLHLFIYTSAGIQHLGPYTPFRWRLSRRVSTCSRVARRKAHMTQAYRPMKSGRQHVKSNQKYTLWRALSSEMNTRGRSARGGRIQRARSFFFGNASSSPPSR